MHRNANRETEKEKWAVETILKIFNHLDNTSEQENEEAEDELAYINGALSSVNGVLISLKKDDYKLDERMRMCKECEAKFRGYNAPQHFEKSCVAKEKRTLKAIKEVLLKNTIEDIPIANDNVEEVLKLGTLQDRRREATRLYEEIRQGWIKISIKVRLDVRKILEVYDAAGRDVSRTSMTIIRMVSIMNEAFRAAVGEMHVKDVAEDTYLLADEQPSTSGTASRKEKAKGEEKPPKADSKTKQSESKEDSREENEGHRRKTSRDEQLESKEETHEEDEGHRRKNSKDNNDRAKSSRDRENSRDKQPESKEDNREEDGGFRRKKDNNGRVKSSRDRENSRKK